MFSFFTSWRPRLVIWEKNFSVCFLNGRVPPDALIILAGATVLSICSLFPAYFDYRFYSPNIIRYDTIIPVTVSLIYLLGLSSVLPAKFLKPKRIIFSLYLLILTIFAGSYSLKDIHVYYSNKCEKEALTVISKSSKKIIPLECTCNILSWNPVTNYHKSSLNAKLLVVLGITKDIKWYYSVNAGSFNEKILTSNGQR